MNTLNLAQLCKHVGELFTFTHPSGEEYIFKLADAKSFPPSQGWQAWQFIFDSHNKVVPPEDTYTVKHIALGEYVLFSSAKSPTEHEIIFNIRA